MDMDTVLGEDAPPSLPRSKRKTMTKRKRSGPDPATPSKKPKKSAPQKTPETKTATVSRKKQTVAPKSTTARGELSSDRIDPADAANDEMSDIEDDNEPKHQSDKPQGFRAGPSTPNRRLFRGWEAMGEDSSGEASSGEDSSGEGGESDGIPGGASPSVSEWEPKRSRAPTSAINSKAIEEEPIPVSATVRQARERAQQDTIGSSSSSKGVGGERVTLASRGSARSSPVQAVPSNQFIAINSPAREGPPGGAGPATPGTSKLGKLFGVMGRGWGSRSGGSAGGGLDDHRKEKPRGGTASAMNSPVRLSRAVNPDRFSASESESGDESGRDDERRSASQGIGPGLSVDNSSMRSSSRVAATPEGEEVEVEVVSDRVLGPEERDDRDAGVKVKREQLEEAGVTDTILAGLNDFGQDLVGVGAGVEGSGSDGD
jgi:hypothetical protein